MTDVTMIAGLANGSTTFIRICPLPAPSILAASSISTGIVSKYPFIFQMLNMHMLPA